MNIRKWYFAINESGLLHAFDQVRAAVRSANKNTSLNPYCLIDSSPMSSSANDRIANLEENGVKIIRHRSSFLPLLYGRFRKSVLPYSGHWLRCDIPDLEQEDEYILYTDIDVVFLKDPASISLRPNIIACAPEHQQDDFSYFNSGVMIMNLPALRATSGKLRNAVAKRLTLMQPHDDQGVLNECYKNQWDRLPNMWNWKPYWGINENIGLIHFHGPKPGNVREMLGGAVSIFGPDFETIFNRNPAAYRQYLQIFDEF